MLEECSLESEVLLSLSKNLAQWEESQNMILLSLIKGSRIKLVECSAKEDDAAHVLNREKWVAAESLLKLLYTSHNVQESTLNPCVLYKVNK